MSETVLQILLLPLGLLLYGSGFLFWPIRRWVRRSRIRGRSLGFVFLGQLAAYVAVAGCWAFIKFDHLSSLVWELNEAFTVAAVIALLRDVRYERIQETNRAA